MKFKKCIDCKNRKNVITGRFTGYNSCDHRDYCDGNTHYQKGIPQTIYEFELGEEYEP